MTTLKRPGVFLEERPPLAIPPAGTISTSTAAIFGACGRGPTTPTLCESYSDFQRVFGDVGGTSGYSGAPSELPFQAYAFFANGGGRLFAARVAGAGAAPATRELTDRAAVALATLVVNAANPGTWGNNIYIDISDTPGSGAPATQFDLTVYLGGTTAAYVVERFTGLTMTTTDSRYALAVVNNATTGSRYVQLAQPAVPSTTAAPGNLPLAQQGRQLANGADGAAVTDGDISAVLAKYDAIQEPLNMAVAGATTGQQSLALSYAQNRGDVFVACDLPVTTGLTATDAITAAGTLLSTSYGAVYWPNLVVNNPVSNVPGATRIQGPSGSVLGLIALTDATRGVQKAPAGTGARIAGALAPQVVLSNADLDNLNVAQVNAIRHLPGSGVVVFGARTLKQGASDRYVPIRRSLIYVKSNVIQLSQFALFEENTADTRESVESTLERFLTEAWQRGVLKGASAREAFYVVCDESNNTTTSISQGIVNVEVGVSLITPAEYIVIKVGQFEGGATATEV